MNRNKRAQAPKRTTRHDNNSDKSRMRSGPVIRGQRFDRNDYRNQSMRGEW
jgi:hypothetical protein